MKLRGVLEKFIPIGWGFLFGVLVTSIFIDLKGLFLTLFLASMMVLIALLIAVMVYLKEYNKRHWFLYPTVEEEDYK